MRRVRQVSRSNTGGPAIWGMFSVSMLARRISSRCSTVTIARSSAISLPC